MGEDILSSPLPPTTSPKPQSKELSFTDAIGWVVIGRKMHKLEWKDRGFYGFMEKEILSLHKPDGTVHSWILSTGDLEGKDYIILE